MKQELERCYFCGHGTLESRRVTVDLRRGERLIVIRNVPALVCDTCGERQYSLETSRAIGRLVEDVEQAGHAEEELRVPVVSMA